MSDFITKPFLAITQPSLHLSAGRIKLSASEYEAYVSLQEAWDKVREISEQAHAEADAIRAKYREEGLSLGRSDAQKEAMECMAQMQSSMHDWVKNTDTQLIELVNRCVGEVVNEIDPTLLSKQSIEKGLSELADSLNINVRVNKKTPQLEETVAEMTRKYGISGQVRILEDGTLADGDVVVESPMGIVDLRIQNQLQLIQKALKP